MVLVIALKSLYFTHIFSSFFNFLRPRKISTKVTSFEKCLMMRKLTGNFHKNPHFQPHLHIHSCQQVDQWDQAAQDLKLICLVLSLSCVSLKKWCSPWLKECNCAFYQCSGSGSASRSKFIARFASGSVSPYLVPSLFS